MHKRYSLDRIFEIRKVSVAGETEALNTREHREKVGKDGKADVALKRARHCIDRMQADLWSRRDGRRYAPSSDRKRRRSREM